MDPKHIYMAPEGDDAGAGGGGQGDDKGGQGDQGAGEKSIFTQNQGGDQSQGGDQRGDTGGEGGDKGTAGQTPEQIALNAADKDTRRPAHIPAKFWDHEKGEIKHEAMAKSYGDLEARMKDVGLPPKAADEYKFEVPKEFADLGMGQDPDVSKAFREEAHKQGLTQKQYEWMMSKYYGDIENNVDHATRFSGARLQKELTEHYKTPEATQQAVNGAFAVIKAFGDEAEIAAASGPQGNLPTWAVRVFAKINKEMGEDAGLNNDSILAAESLDELMRGKPGAENSPYWNPQDPQHKTVVAKVQRHHAAVAAANQRKAA